MVEGINVLHHVKGEGNYMSYPFVGASECLYKLIQMSTLVSEIRTSGNSARRRLF